MSRRKSVDVSLDGLAGKLGAEIFSESPGFVCLLPQDVHESVLGRGSSVSEAINNWDEKLKAHLRNSTFGDPVVDHVQKILSSTTPDHVQSFYDQFYPVRKKQ